MPPHAYFVTLETRHPFDADTYTRAAGELSNTLQSTLGDYEKLCSITHTPNLTDARVEVEIAQREPEPESPITARAVVKALTPGKMQFDKNMFSKMVKESLSFPVKITKQAVSQEELAPSLFQT
tara:strand:- start:539 stop:910 length:372 start_codon:yes stop_codon:yes gene_type:complete